MTMPLSTVPQSGSDAAEIARIDAKPQATGAVKSTVISDGDKSVRITTDQNGNTRIERTGGSGAPAVVGGPPPPGMPGMLAPDGLPPSGGNVIPPQAVDLAYGFFLMLTVMVVGWPIARAFGRRIEQRGDTAALPPAAADQLRRIEQAVEAMAIEVERISESQRFMAKLQSGSTAERV
jgi:hypothetical protein